jgi:glycosyltransferase involved in cell wall biosynthesis
MSIKNPKVTVILPAHRCWQYIGEAVRSILDQGFSDLEIVIVYIPDQDGRMSEALLALPKDERVRSVPQDGVGYSSACNQAYRISRGEYVCFQDCDDISMPDRLAKEVEILDLHPDVEMVFSGCYHLDDDDETFCVFSDGPSQVMRGDRAFQRLFIEGNFIPNPTVMFKRRHLQDGQLFDERLRTSSDYEHNIRIAHDYDIYHIEEPLVKIRRGESLGNMSSFREENFRSLEIIYFDAYNKYRGRDPRFTFRQFIKVSSDLKARYSYHMFSQRKYLRAAMLLLLAFYYNPSNILLRLKMILVKGRPGHDQKDDGK